MNNIVNRILGKRIKEHLIESAKWILVAQGMFLVHQIIISYFTKDKNIYENNKIIKLLDALSLISIPIALTGAMKNIKNADIYSEAVIDYNTQKEFKEENDDFTEESYPVSDTTLEAIADSIYNNLDDLFIREKGIQTADDTKNTEYNSVKTSDENDD